MLRFNIGKGRVNCLAFSPLGDCIAVGSGDRTVYLLHWPGGDVRHRLPSSSHLCVPRQLAFHQNGQSVSAVYTDDATVEWNVANGRVVNTWQPQGWTRFQAKPLGLWFSDDLLGWEWAYHHGNEFAVAALGKRQERELFPTGAQPGWVWRDGADHLLTLSKKQLRRFRRQTDQFEPNPPVWRQLFTSLVRPILGSRAPVLIPESVVTIPGHVPHAAALWPNQQAILIGSAQSQARRVSRQTGQLIRSWGLPVPAIHSLAISPDATVAVAGSTQGTILIWDLDD